MLLTTRKAGDMARWEKTTGKIIKDLEALRAPSRFVRFKANVDKIWLWSEETFTSLLVPFFDRTTRVLVCGGSGDDVPVDWPPGFILHLDEDTGIRPLAEDFVFHLTQFELLALQGMKLDG